jgi:hypothetical protein
MARIEDDRLAEVKAAFGRAVAGAVFSGEVGIYSTAYVKALEKVADGMHATAQAITMALGCEEASVGDCRIRGTHRLMLVANVEKDITALADLDKVKP